MSSFRLNSCLTFLEEFVRLIVTPGSKFNRSSFVEEVFAVHQIQACWKKKQNGIEILTFTTTTKILSPLATSVEFWAYQGLVYFEKNGTTEYYAKLILHIDSKLIQFYSVLQM